MADPIQATKSEAIKKLLDGVLRPNTVYIWLDKTYAENEAVISDILEGCYPEGIYYYPSEKPQCPRFKKRVHELHFDNGSQIWFRSANNPDHLRGFRVNGLVSTLTDRNEEALLSALTCITQTKGWVVIINDKDVH